MSTLTVDNNPATIGNLQRCIEDFVAGGRRRSVIVNLHKPVTLTWSVNPHIEHTAASLLKLPLVGGLLIAGSRYDVSLDHRVHPDRLSKTRYPTIRTGFSVSTITLLELSSLAILTSDNAAATYILDLIGDGPYRRFLSSAGCEHTGIPPGFSDRHFPQLQRTMTTATDQSRIVDYVWSIDALRPLRIWMANNIRNTRLSARTEYPTIFAHKTGTLNGAVHDIGMLTTPNLQASVVVLTSGESDPVVTSVQMADLGSYLTDELETLAQYHQQ